jgi:hypothetical protein
MPSAPGFTAIRAIASGDDYVLIDDEERALRNSFRAPVRAVCASNISFGLKIREQREVQVTGFRKGPVTPDSVDGHIHYLRPNFWNSG